MPGRVGKSSDQIRYENEGQKELEIFCALENALGALKNFFKYGMIFQAHLGGLEYV
jgi:hypothetical protein